MSKLKQPAILLLRLALAFVAMVIAYTVGFMVIGDTGVAMTPEETAQAVLDFLQQLPTPSLAG